MLRRLVVQGKKRTRRPRRRGKIYNRAITNVIVYLVPNDDESSKFAALLADLYSCTRLRPLSSVRVTVYSVLSLQLCVSAGAQKTLRARLFLSAARFGASMFFRNRP